MLQSRAQTCGLSLGPGLEGFASLSVAVSRTDVDLSQKFGLDFYLSVLQPSSIRALATRRTYFLHLSPSSVILIDSSTESPVHVLMLSIQAVRGLPRLHAPGSVPCFTSFSTQLP